MTDFTMTSPTAGGALPSNITAAGGIVLDLVGVNGVRVVAQLSASSLFKGFFDGGVAYGDPEFFIGEPVEYQGNPGTIGILSGLSPATLAALGGGLAQMAVRMTLYDGDTSSGGNNFDHNDNFFMINGIQIANMSDVQTQATSANGQTEVAGSGLGFRDNTLSTGWFSSSDPDLLAQVYNSLVQNNQAAFQLYDSDPYDNFYDFKQGLSGGLVDVGSGPNVAPVAGADDYTLHSDHTLVVDAAHGVLANDHDAEGANLTLELVDGPTNGTLTLNPDGSFTYVPNAGYTGSDTFTYRISDGLLSTVGSVTLSVGQNRAPVAVDDAYELDVGETLNVNALAGVLANDSDLDQDNLTVSLDAAPEHGDLVLNADGSFTYIPDAGFSGEDTFTYIVSDGAISRSATVRLNVVNPNVAPDAVADVYEVARGGTLDVGALQGVLANDTDANGNALTAAILQGPRHGTFVFRPDGSFVYVPDPGFFGEDSFTYSVSDGQLSDSVTVTINVLGPVGEHIVLTEGDDPYVSYEYRDHAVFVEALGGNDAVVGSGFDDILEGGAGDDYLNGGAGNDDLVGGAGNDRLLGGSGDNTLRGGAGDDTYYVRSANDIVIEGEGAGEDAVSARVSFTLGDHIETLYLEGIGNINGTGNGLNNSILGNSGSNVIDGGAGDDRLNGEGGSDTVIGGLGNDTIYGDSSRWAGDDLLVGGAGDDQLYGQGGADTVNGGAGADYMLGGTGNDTFVFNRDDMAAGELDIIVDFAGIGTSGEGQQDELVFEGFSQDATLVFDHYGYGGTQYYRVEDPNAPGHEGMILIYGDASGTLLDTSDYRFI